MRKIKTIAFLMLGLAFTVQVNAADVKAKTAESVFEMAKNMETLNVEVLKAEMDGLTKIERQKLMDMAMEDVKKAESSGSLKPSPGMYVLAVLLPWVAVGLHTNWSMSTVYNILWSFLFVIPGIIHAFIVLGR
jgi:uncharacterized membrane protein YqaE (UPF0057 family)